MTANISDIKILDFKQLKLKYIIQSKYKIKKMKLSKVNNRIGTTDLLSN